MSLSAWECVPGELPGNMLRNCFRLWRHGEDLDEMEKFIARASVEIISLRATLARIAEASTGSGDRGDNLAMWARTELERR